MLKEKNINKETRYISKSLFNGKMKRILESLKFLKAFFCRLKWFKTPGLIFFNPGNRLLFKYVIIMF